jgi:hypothetical protein
MRLIQKRTPGSFSQGLTGKVLRKIIIPAYRKRTGKKLNQLQAEWIVQGHFNRLWQYRFAAHDSRARPYREVACECEFGPELKYYLPYAYWHHLNGTLKRTVSFAGTAPFYFFSPDHVERAGERKYFLDPDIPNSEDHNFSYAYRRWARVPLKETYRNALNFGFDRDKPLVIISNKYNIEWEGHPVNFLSPEILGRMIERLLPHHTIVYNRPGNGLIVVDRNEVQELREKDFLKAHFPEVLFAEELFAKKRQEVTGFNHLQLCLYAQCERFISVQGGNSVLASYFGGTNLIYQRQGSEIFFGELNTIYPQLAGTACHGFSDYESLLEAVDRHYGTRAMASATTKPL